jgi:hypothetical protein
MGQNKMLKVISRSVDLMIDNDQGHSFFLKNVVVGEKSLMPFRVMLWLAEAEFKDTVYIPLPPEWYAHMTWCVGCCLRRDKDGDMFIVVKNKEGSAEFQIDPRDIYSFYDTDEFASSTDLVPGQVIGTFTKRVGVADDMLVVGDDFIIVVDDGGICALFLKNEPYTIYDREVMGEKAFREKCKSLSIIIRGLYETDEDD